MQDEVEIIKKEISLYFNRTKYLDKLYDKKYILEYQLTGVKAIEYSKQKGNVNMLTIEEKKLDLMEKIEKIDEKIKKEYREIKNIEKIIFNINENYEKKIIKKDEKTIMPSTVILNVLCGLKTYKEACQEYEFNSTSSLYNYINRAIENYLEGE